MAVFIDMDNLSFHMKEYALQLIFRKEILKYNDIGEKVIKAENYEDLLESISPIEANMWWIGFATGIEVLLKSWFLHHEVLVINKKEYTSKFSGISNVDIKDLYMTIRKEKVKASKSFLNNTFTAKNIEYVSELSTGTLGSMSKELKELVDSNIITMDERKRLEDIIVILSDFRRNPNAHLYLKLIITGTRKVSKGCNTYSELEFYLELINLILSKY